jgi:hypothetical protein
MKITHKTSTQLIVQNSFAENSGIFLISIALSIIGLFVFIFPELSVNSEQRKEVSMSLTGMGAVLLLNWAIGGFTTWIFDKNDSYLTVIISYLFILKISCKYSLNEINEVRLESQTDDGIKSFGVKISTKENKEIFTGFFDYSGEVTRDLVCQISKFLNLPAGNSLEDTSVLEDCSIFKKWRGND